MCFYKLLHFKGFLLIIRVGNICTIYVKYTMYECKKGERKMVMLFDKNLPEQAYHTKERPCSRGCGTLIYFEARFEPFQARLELSLQAWIGLNLFKPGLNFCKPGLNLFKPGWPGLNFSSQAWTFSSRGLNLSSRAWEKPSHPLLSKSLSEGI